MVEQKDERVLFSPDRVLLLHPGSPQFFWVGEKYMPILFEPTKFLMGRPTASLWSSSLLGPNTGRAKSQDVDASPVVPLPCLSLVLSTL